MTKKNALTIALSALNSLDTDVALEARETISKMIDSFSMTDEQKAKQNEKRKAATATARIALVNKVAPILRKYLTSDVSAKELFALASDELPQDFSANKVQNILLREMRPELVIVEAKGKANTYRLA